MFGYETGSLFAHIADEVHEHMPNGEIVWHHVEQVQPVAAAAANPLPMIAVVVILVATSAFAILFWRASRTKAASA